MDKVKSDKFCKMFAEYTASVSFDKLSKQTIHEVKRRIIDSLGVIIAAFHSDTPKTVRAYAYKFPNPEGATILGTTYKTNPEIAGFVNSTMVRYLDFNDTYLSLEPLHPSDMIPTLFSLAEWKGLSGRDLITAIAIAYEIPVTLCDAASLRVNRWDHVNYIAIGTAAGAAKLLSLNKEQTEHAISIAIVPHAAMRQTRAGELSMWKGAAAANSARNALFASLLAAEGMTGPYQPFEGEMGFFKLLTKKPFAEKVLKSISRGNPPRRILDTYIKFYPVEYHAQSAVDAVLQLGKEIGDPQKIDEITIDTFKVGYEIIAKDPEKWAPKTRETADHSLPYIVVVGLLDGKVTKESFSEERIREPRARAILKNKTQLREDPELTKGYPDGIPNRISVKTKDGKVYVKEVKYPRGHAKNRMSDEEVMEKFRNCVEEKLSQSQIEALLEVIWKLERCKNIAEIPKLLVL